MLLRVSRETAGHVGVSPPPPAPGLSVSVDRRTLQEREFICRDFLGYTGALIPTVLQIFLFLIYNAPVVS